MKRTVAAIALVLTAAIVAIGQPHAYSVPGHSGIVIGDCYHFDAGYELQSGFFVDQC